MFLAARAGRAENRPKGNPPACATWRGGRRRGGIADFDDYLLAEDGESGLELLGPRGVVGIGHAADRSLVQTQAAGQLG